MYLEHYGVLGMKWGVRRYQNKDGTLTAEGKKKRAKARKELSSMRPWFEEDFDSVPKEKQNEMLEVYRKVKDRPISDKERKLLQNRVDTLLNDFPKTSYYSDIQKWRQTIDGLNDRIASMAIKSIGYEDTKEARKIVSSMIFD